MSQVKVCRDCKEEKPLSAFQKKERGLFGVRAECNECRSKARRLRYQTDFDYRERARASCRKAIAKDPKRNQERVRIWAEENRQKANATKRKWMASNKDAMKKHRQAWLDKNKYYSAKACAKRKAKQLRATVSWANVFFISEIYALAKERTRITGVMWEVDHIVPLISSTVCGLHVEHNLRVITARENRSKCNRYWPDMP